MPTLTPSASSTPSVWNGGSKPAMSSRAAPTTSSAPDTPGRTTANCSPPSRARWADSGSSPLIRPHAWISSPSALRCPNASTTWLNESRSTTMRPTRPRSSYAPSIASSSSSWSRVRLGTPVSGSCRAWWARSSASRASRWNSTPFSMAIDAWSASEPSSDTWASPKLVTALRRAWVTTRAPTTDRSVPVIGATIALDPGDLQPPRRGRPDPDPAGRAGRHDGMDVGQVLGRRHLGRHQPPVAQPDAAGRLVLSHRAQQQHGVVGPQQLPGGLQHRRGDLGQVGRPDHRGHELEVGLQAPVALGHAGVEAVRGDAGPDEGGDQAGPRKGAPTARGSVRCRCPR